MGVGAEQGGPAWLGALPAPFEPHISFVTPATLADGTEAVLKINYPAARGVLHDAERRAL